MRHLRRRTLAIVVATTLALAPLGLPPAQASGAARTYRDPAQAGATTVRVDGVLNAVVQDGPGRSDVRYAVTGADDRPVEIAADFATPPASGSRFVGELVVPPRVAAAASARGSSSSAAVLDELRRETVPATVASARIEPVAPPASSPKPHAMYVAKIADHGSYLLDDAQLQHTIEEAGAYWATEADGEITGTFAVAGFASMSSAAATLPNACGFAGGFGGVVAAGEALFPGVDFGADSGNHLVVLAPPSCAGDNIGLGFVGASLASTGVGTLVAAGAQLETTVAHELGHNFGLGHASGRFCAAGSCQTHEYFDLYDVMGYSTSSAVVPVLDTVQRVREDSVDPGEIADVTATAAGTTLTLAPRSSRSGLRAARVTGPDGEIYYVEYRSGSGDDAGTTYTQGLVFEGPAGPGDPVLFEPGITVLQAVDYECDHDSGVVLSTRAATDGQHGGFPAGTVFTSESGRVRVAVDTIAGGAAQVTVTSSASTAGPPVARLRAAGAPVVTGSPAPGSVLRVRNTTWTGGAGLDPARIAVTYDWSRDGTPIAGAAGRASYAVRAADAGRTIRAVVSATAPGQLPGTAQSEPVRIGRATSSLRVSVSSLGRRIVVAPSLRLPGTATSAVSATVRIYVDGRLRKTLRTTRGKARYRTAAVARGRHRVTVTYAGSTAYRPDSGKASLTTR